VVKAQVRNAGKIRAESPTYRPHAPSFVPFYTIARATIIIFSEFPAKIACQESKPVKWFKINHIALAGEFPPFCYIGSSRKRLPSS
jgi:hypothetical protein